MTRLLALIPGDTREQFLFFPTLETLHHHSKHPQIDVVVEPQAQGAYDVSPTVSNVYTFNFGGGNGPADWSNLMGKIREQEYDAILTPARHWTLRLLMWLLGIPARIGYDGGIGTFLLSASVSYPTGKPQPEIYHQLTQGFGLQLPCPPLSIQIPATTADWLAAESQRLNLAPEQPYVLLYDPGTGNTNHSSYPIANWKAIVDGIKERFPSIPIVLIQDDGNRSWVNDLSQRSLGLQTSNPLTIGAMAALIQGAKVVVTPDSAPLYLTIGCRRPLVGLFGKNNPCPSLVGTNQEAVEIPPAVFLQASSKRLGDIPPIQILENL
jgi:ADP-heptose:LPS heptosyltransferase